MKQNKKKRIGIYGGTFDPIHFGHINLAIQIRELRQLDEVWFCPVQINPHKQNQIPTSFEHRFAMLQLAIAPIPYCSITDIESQREGPSYTIDTLNALKNQKGAESIDFSFVMGDDALPSFCRWHRPEEIVKLVHIYIGRRQVIVPNPEKMSDIPLICEAMKKGMTETTLVSISGTDIRKRLKEGLYCGHLIPEKVIDYIFRHRLY